MVTVFNVSQIRQYDSKRWRDYWEFSDLSIKRMIADVLENRNIRVKRHMENYMLLCLLRGVDIKDLADVLLLYRIDNDYQCIISVVAKKVE